MDQVNRLYQSINVVFTHVYKKMINLHIRGINQTNDKESETLYKIKKCGDESRRVAGSRVLLHVSGSFEICRGMY